MKLTLTVHTNEKMYSNKGIGKIYSKRVTLKIYTNYKNINKL